MFKIDPDDILDNIIYANQNESNDNSLRDSLLENIMQS